MSLRLVDQFEGDQLHKRFAAQAALAKLSAATLDEGEPLVSGLLGAPDLLDLVACRRCRRRHHGDYRA